MMGAIGVDWGSSNLRAYLLDGSGVVVDRFSSTTGVKGLLPHEFESCLFGQLDHWSGTADKIFLSGMVTSRNGWVESPYATCPTPVGRLLDLAVCKNLRGKKLYFMPGVSQLVPQPDVMRGEEMQIMGLGPLIGRHLIILPGTHSKWVVVNDGVIERFCTIMTGEVFDLLLNHSLAGRLARDRSMNGSAFLEGIQRGHVSGSPISDAFGARARVLLGAMAADATSAYLSGLLIGNEIREGALCLNAGFTNVTLIGEPSLCDLYRLALHSLGYHDVKVANATSEAAFSVLALQTAEPEAAN